MGISEDTEFLSNARTMGCDAHTPTCIHNPQGLFREMNEGYVNQDVQYYNLLKYYHKMLLWYNLAGERAFCGNWIDTGNVKPMMLNENEDVMIIKKTKLGNSFAGASTKRPTKATDKESHDSWAKASMT